MSILATIGLLKMNKGLQNLCNPLILLVGRAGIEPTTNGLKERRPSYRPI